MSETNLSLQLTRDESKTECRQMTEGMLDPAVRNAEVATLYSLSGGWGNVGLTEAMQVLAEKTKAVNGGDLRDLEGTLVAQSAALNSIFVELARRAQMNMGTHLDATERYLKLALKAQGQCRTTIEALALLKNPPVYARQANINNGGQQQVNNGVPADPVRSARAREAKQKQRVSVCTHGGTLGVDSDPERSARARAREEKIEQTELLEASHGQRMDTRTKSKARRGHQTLEAVGEVHRPQD